MIQELMSGGWKDSGPHGPNGGRFCRDGLDYDVVVVKVPKRAQVNILLPPIQLVPMDGALIDGPNVSIIPVPQDILANMLKGAGVGSANDEVYIDASDPTEYRACGDCGTDCRFKDQDEEQPCWGQVGSDENQMAHVCVGHRQSNAYLHKPPLN